MTPNWTLTRGAERVLLVGIAHELEQYSDNKTELTLCDGYGNQLRVAGRFDVYRRTRVPGTPVLEPWPIDGENDGGAGTHPLGG